MVVSIVHYVYLIQSQDNPDHHYIGSTSDLKTRMKAHNSGQSKHTTKFRPWKLVGYPPFADKRKAQEFEHYLKTGSGQAFANKRLWSSS